MSTSYGGDGGSPYAGDGGASYVEDGGSTAFTTDAQHDAETQSLGTMVTNLSADLSKLMRMEMALAKAELKDEVAKAGKGAGMLAGAGYAGHLAVVFLSFTIVWLLDLAMDIWLAALIVTVLWAIVAGVLFAMGRKNLKSVDPKTQQTVDSLKEDAQWLKPQKS